MEEKIGKKMVCKFNNSVFLKSNLSLLINKSRRKMNVIKNDVTQQEYFNLVLKFKQSNTEYTLYVDNFVLGICGVLLNKLMTN